jgi:glycosyltransferase involved in cell wall biosynthesis
MRVLFITRKYPPSVGGMELFAFELSNTLVRKVDLKLVKWSGSGRARAVLVGLPYLFFRALATLMRGGVDVIHVHDGVLAPSGYILARLFRKPLVVVINGLEATYQNPLFRLVVPGAVRRASLVVCISQTTAEELVKRHGVSPDKIRVIPLAVEDTLHGMSNRAELLKQLELPAESKILLSVGRLVKRKGVAWFISNVLPDLVKRYPEVVYLVAGDGDGRAGVAAAVKRARMSKHVRLLGKVNEQLRAAAYNGADVFVMPNITVPGDMEGFGLVLLEAALCALPIVAADLEGIKDAVSNDKNGVLVPAEDAPAFLGAITRFLDDEDYAKKFGQNSRWFTLVNHRWDMLGDRYIDQYKSLLR